jgi:hypothetical protein
MVNSQNFSLILFIQLQAVFFESLICEKAAEIFHSPKNTRRLQPDGYFGSRCNWGF